MYQKIKDLCVKKGVSVYALEKTLHLSTGSVSKWDKSSPRVETLQKISNFFGVPITYFLEDQPTASKE